MTTGALVTIVLLRLLVLAAIGVTVFVVVVKTRAFMVARRQQRDDRGR